MCGFLGEFTYKSNNLLSSDKFEKLLLLSKHRGPDNTTVLKQNNFQLGFNRLAILDISEAGNQPMESLSGKYHIVFNGEIYNYKDLITSYNLSNLKSTSDTEVIVQLLDKIGVKKTIVALNGMFAIAIVNKESNKLYLTRDFAGIKPLFYGVSEEGVVFASQFDQIFKHYWHKNSLKLRPEIIKEYFGFGYMSAPNTIYKDIFQVNPGEIVKVSSQGEVKKKYYLKFSKNVLTTHRNTIGNSYLNTLKKVVKSQLISDVPIATFLSGGIDSPLVSSVAKELNHNIEAYTFGVNHLKFDESKKAKVYANSLNIKQIVETIDEKELIASIDDHFKYITEPFGDYSSIPTFVITKKTRETKTVMLSGDGGDELFFGYPRMLDVLNKQDWFNFPYFLRKPLVRLLNKLRIINTWAPYTYRSLEKWIQSKQMHLSPQLLDRFFLQVPFSKELNELYRIPKNQSKRKLLHWLRWNEFYGHMQRVLIKVDRMSMGNSLEVRVPFLDKDSISYAWSKVPLKLRNHQQLKNELKNSLKHYISKDIIEQQKKGFSVPINDWLRNELKEEVKEHILNIPFYGEEIMNIKNVRNFVTEFFEGKHNNGWGVWHIYAWQKWANKHIYNN